MDSLFKSLQLDKQFVRQHDLLRYMYANNGTQTTQELTSILNISAPTLRAELSYLKLELKEYLRIISVKKGEFVLLLEPTVSIDEVLSFLAKSTLVYRIIHHAFYVHQFSQLQMLRELGVSRTTYLRILTHMNGVLRKYHISLSSGVLRFIGKEDDIRTFLFYFYLGFGDSSIISSTADQDARDWLHWNTSERFRKQLRYNHFRAALWLSIVQVRHRSKTFVTLDRSFLQEIQQHKVYQHFKLVATKLLQKYYISLQIPEDEIAWIYVVSLHCVTYSSTNSDLMETEFLYHRPEDATIVPEIKEFIRRGPIACHDLDDRNLRMFAFLKNVYSLSKLSKNFELSLPELIEYMRSTYSKVFYAWVQLLEDWNCSGQQLCFDSCESIAACLTTILMTPEKPSSLVPMRVLFALQGAPGLDEYILQISKLILSKDVHIHYFFEGTIYKEQLEQFDVDLILSNYDLHFTKNIQLPYLRLSRIPTAKDWEVVKTMTETLRMNKSIHSMLVG